MVTEVSFFSADATGFDWRSTWRFYRKLIFFDRRSFASRHSFRITCITCGFCLPDLFSKCCLVGDKPVNNRAGSLFVDPTPCKSFGRTGNVFVGRCFGKFCRNAANFFPDGVHVLGIGFLDATDATKQQGCDTFKCALSDNTFHRINVIALPPKRLVFRVTLLGTLDAFGNSFFYGTLCPTQKDILGGGAFNGFFRYTFDYFSSGTLPNSCTDLAWKTRSVRRCTDSGTKCNLVKVLAAIFLRLISNDSRLLVTCPGFLRPLVRSVVDSAFNCTGTGSSTKPSHGGNRRKA